MMKNYVKVFAVAVCLTGLFGSHQAAAQKVYASEGKVYLDCGPGTGYPQRATTTESKMQSGTPTNEVVFPTMEVSGEEGTRNANIYSKLEVAKTSTPSLMWAAAYLYCRDTYPATGGGTGWRLPTQRELILMWIFRNALKDLGCDALSTSSHMWSCTEAVVKSQPENDGKYAWLLTSTVGTTGLGYKTNPIPSRCVREVAL